MNPESILYKVLETEDTLDRIPYLVTDLVFLKTDLF